MSNHLPSKATISSNKHLQMSMTTCLNFRSIGLSSPYICLFFWRCRQELLYLTVVLRFSQTKNPHMREPVGCFAHCMHGRYVLAHIESNQYKLAHMCLTTYVPWILASSKIVSHVPSSATLVFDPRTQDRLSIYHKRCMKCTGVNNLVKLGMYVNCMKE